jgi:hypothetical protein
MPTDMNSRSKRKKLRKNVTNPNIKFCLDFEFASVFGYRQDKYTHETEEVLTDMHILR